MFRTMAPIGIRRSLRRSPGPIIGDRCRAARTFVAYGFAGAGAFAPERGQISSEKA